MRNDDTTTSPSAEPDRADETPDEATAAELSRAAREAVRQPADPRIDRQLARMGLAATPEPADPRPGAEAADAVRRELETTRTTLDAATRRLDVLTWVVTAEGIAIAILALIVLAR